MKENSNITIVRLAQLALLTAISIVLVALVHFPLIPGLQFLEYDPADIPILIAALLFGSGPALIVLFVASAIQAFIFGGNGWVGLVMHFVASGALVVLTSAFYHRRHKFLDAIIGLVIGSLAMTALMIPMNYIFTVHVFGTPFEIVNASMWVGIVPLDVYKRQPSRRRRAS